MQKEGLIVAVDGRDAVGKTTLSKLLVDSLSNKGIEADSLPEFSETDLGQMISDNAKRQRFYSLSGDGTSPVADTLALAADMLLKARQAQNLKKQGKVAISDRGMLSFYGYQGVRIDSQNGEANYQGNSDWVANFARNIIFQDITFWLRVSDEEMKRRIAMRSEMPLSQEDILFLKNVEQMMEVRQELGTNTVIVDAERDVDELLFWMTKIITHILTQDLDPLAVCSSFLTADDSSLLLVKPEVSELDRVDRHKFYNHIRDLTNGIFVGKLDVKLNFPQSRAMWERAISEYPWQFKYYHHMTTAPVEAIVLRGNASATRIKRVLRDAWQGTINALSTETPFKMELVHGSEPADFQEEMNILNLDVATRIGIK